jgi:uncharacterized membrane protein
VVAAVLVVFMVAVIFIVAVILVVVVVIVAVLLTNRNKDGHRSIVILLGPVDFPFGDNKRSWSRRQ